jgi:hypothetical protein
VDVAELFSGAQLSRGPGAEHEPENRYRIGPIRHSSTISREFT